ncbi:MAG TPA: hypothetical protein VIJ79_08530 [Acidobacteriaceae bacterium]
MENWKKILLRAAGFGGGFAIVGAIILCGIIWWADKPPKDKPFNTKAISAKYSGLGFQRRSDDFHLIFEYSLHNNTDKDYRLPSNSALMIVNPENGGLQKVADTTWDTDTVVPVGQTVNLKFDVPYKLADYNLQPSDYSDSKDVEFAGRRLKEINGIKVFDYTDRYEIDCPKWPITPATP